ncbi:vWA-like protein [Hyphopichia burtonii NRRL Y-1933]|uniref:Protein transport protein SEC23 n=1 Tax=Hyphopichia burtonii NRRL Y-1933 TaxID=984485 RepID=A0A1E4RT98_9ASCO|nr:vWA-like protein [Hyphopichia burtonii NRRL Y-1933]ODV70490.1 vWA-like protein [Hyphopichia burtonii NRRL Y-1933]
MLRKEYQQEEHLQGVRFNWNVFPSTRLEQSQLLTLVGCLYKPFNESETIPTLTSHAISCSSCLNYINPYIKIDRINQMWWCPFCCKRSYFPEGYEFDNITNDISVNPSSSTIDYILPEDISNPIVSVPKCFIYIIDKYQHRDEVDHKSFLIDNVKKNINSLPAGSLVMLISFSDTVEVHNLNGDSVMFTQEELFSKAKNFDLKDTPRLISKKLNLTQLASDWSRSDLVTNGYLNDAHKIKLDKLKTELTNTYKPVRATGMALLICSIILNQSSFKHFVGKVSLLTSGPVTLQPGAIVGSHTGETVRSHHDVLNLKSPYFISSFKFYSLLGQLAIGHTLLNALDIVHSSKTLNIPSDKPRFVVDIYTGSLDQVGVYEMSPLCKISCGNIILSDSFASPHFQRNFQKSTQQFLATKLDAKFSISTSTGAKILRILSGNGSPLPSTYQVNPKLNHMHSEKISDTLDSFDSNVKKVKFTNLWWFNSIEEDTIAIFFEVDTVSSSSKLSGDGIKEIYVQYQMYYKFENSFRLRVTTIRRPTTLSILLKNQDSGMKLINSKTLIMKERDLLNSFDYQAWAVLLARLMINKIDTTLGFGDFETVVKKADLTLVRLLHYFGGISIDKITQSSNPYDSLMSCYRINENFKKLPSLMYNLRRNPQLINIFNSSPDETAVYHKSFMSANTSLSCKMIEPQIHKNYEETTLDYVTLKNLEEGHFLIMDSGFHVIIYYNGKLKLHPSNNDELIFGDSPGELIHVLEFCWKLASDRPIEPKMILTQKGHSQARFLMARLIPEDQETGPPKEPSKKSIGSWFRQLTLSSSSPGLNYALMTEEISLKRFYDELINLVNNYEINDHY